MARNRSRGPQSHKFMNKLLLNLKMFSEKGKLKALKNGKGRRYVVP